MSVFDPIKTRKTFERFTLFYALNKRSEQFEFPEKHADLQTIIDAWLVGLDKDIEPALINGNQWRKNSTLKHDFSYEFARLGEEFGLSSWMLENKINSDAYKQTLNAFDNFYARGYTKVLGPDIFNYQLQKFELNQISGQPFPNDLILKSALDQYLANCIQCGEFERGVALYESAGGNININPKRIKSTLKFGYWVCKQKSQGIEIPIIEYISTGERVLRHHLNDPLHGGWLAYGQSVNAAIWLKIVYWDSGTIKTPLETILKAYDLMPDVTKPNFKHLGSFEKLWLRTKYKLDIDYKINMLLRKLILGNL